LYSRIQKGTFMTLLFHKRWALLMAVIIWSMFDVAPGCGQGSVNFNNRVPIEFGGPQSAVVAPVFGPEPSNPMLRKTGNPGAGWNGTNGPTPAPLGTQVYGGAPLHGTGYTATLWAARTGTPESDLVLISVASFSTRSSLSFYGFWQNPGFAAIVPGVAGGSDDRAVFQVRAWDNQGGTITNWDQLQNPIYDAVPRGYSDMFTVPYPLGAGILVPPNLIGLQSFNLFLPPPVPVLGCSTTNVPNDPGQCSAVVGSYDVTVVRATTVVCDPAPGSTLPVGGTTVTCSASNANGSASCTFTVLVQDREAPRVAVRPAPNPSGRKIPVPDKNPNSVSNPDGFYELLSRDNCDEGGGGIYVADSASSFGAGPFASGDIVKITQAGSTGSRAMAGAVVSHITVRGDALVYALDAAGNVSSVLQISLHPD
jgi:hypothetical protein